MVLQNLLRRRVRTALTVLGISVGLALIVALGAIADGYSASFTSLITRSGADLTVVQAETADMGLSAVDEEAGRKIAQISGVAHVSGTIYSIVSTPGSPYLLLFGYDPEQYAFRHFKVVAGQKLSTRGGTGRTREVMLGRQAADNLKKRVGDSVRLFGTPYRVVGLFETGVAFEDAGGVVTLREAQRMFRKPRQVSLYNVKLDNPEAADRVRRQILDRVDDVSVSRSADFAENTQDVKTTRAFAWAISAISILAGGIGMMNTVLMSVFERTREIGVLRALGWRRRWVLTMILEESLALSLLGAAAGCALGVGLVKLLAVTPIGGILPATFGPRLFVQVVATALLLGALGGCYPAYRAASLRPVEALHYE